MKFYPVALQCGPDPLTDRARIDIEIADGSTITIVLDVAHARALSGRLDEIISGRVMARPPSRRILDLALVTEADVVDTEPPVAVQGEIR